MAEAEEAFYILFAHRWKDERAYQRETYLAAVGVAGKHQVDEREAGMLDDGVDEVRLVAHEEYGGVGRAGDGRIKIAVAGAGVAGAGEPEVVAAAFDGEVVVDQDGGPMVLESVDDVLGAYGDVVIAEDGIALRGGDALEDFGTEAGCPEGDGGGARASADVVAGEQDEFRFEGVDAVDGLFEEPGLGVLLEVDVAELDEAEAYEGVGEIDDGEGAVGDFQLVAAMGAGVGGQAETRGRSANHESAAREVVRIWMRICVWVWVKTWA